jgi:hypothetical protein
MTEASDSLGAYGFDVRFGDGLKYVDGSRSEPQISAAWSQLYVDNGVTNNSSGANFAYQFDGGAFTPQNGPFTTVVGTLTFTVAQGGSFEVTPGFFNPTPDYDGFLDGSFNDISSSVGFSGGTVNVAAVPEPSSMALLATAGIGGWVARRRAARKNAAK